VGGIRLLPRWTTNNVSRPLIFLDPVEVTLYTYRYGSTRSLSNQRQLRAIPQIKLENGIRLSPSASTDYVEIRTAGRKCRRTAARSTCPGLCLVCDRLQIMKLNRHRAITPKLLKSQPASVRRHCKACDLVNTLNDLTNSHLTTALRGDMADTNQLLPAPFRTSVYGHDDISGAKGYTLQIREELARSLREDGL